MSATLNDATVTPHSTMPRLRVLLGTEVIPGAVRASVVDNNWYQADTFHAVFALWADPKYGPAWWSAQDNMLLDVQIGVETDGDVAWTSMIQGVVDHVSVLLTQGVVQIDGRDMAARLIEAKTQESFDNKTASEIVSILAARHQMIADATPTTTQAGVYWKNDHSSVSLGQFSHTTTEWNLLTTLAKYEGFDLYVTGKTLHFHPAVKPDATPWLVNWTPPQLDRGASWGAEANVQDLRLERALTLARDIEVVVRSWHSGQGKAFERKARAIGAKSPQAAKAANQKGFDSNTQRYVKIIPNLTEAQAQQQANSLLADISKHERVIGWQEPGSLKLNARNLVKLTGTGTDFDQTYHIDNVNFSVSFNEGFSMQVRAKNRDARSMATVG